MRINDWSSDVCSSDLIFARNIVLPEPLYGHVVEVDERVTVAGEVLRPLDTENALAALQSAFDQGYRAIAIVLMHGWSWTVHEAAPDERAKDIGYTQRSTRPHVGPLVRM